MAAEYDRGGLEILDVEECLRLLGSVSIGRIVFTDKALPAILPVNYLLYDGSVIIRTGRGSKLATAARNAVVAFEADRFDTDECGLDYHRGWSVTVIGQAQEVTEPTERDMLTRLPLRAWAPGERDHYIRIPTELVSGHRIPTPADQKAG